MLDSLRPTATGLDNLPAWSLRLAALFLCGHVADVINVSLMTSTVPSQWKQARIQPVLKVPSPHQASDYRPISVTPVLTERIVVRRYVYPALAPPPPTLQFHDQFAFRPTGSPHCGHHLSDEYGHQPTYHRTIRHRPLVRFFKSLRYHTTLNSIAEIRTTASFRPCV